MTQLRLFGQALDIPIGQAAHIATDDQRLQWSGADHRLGIRDHLTDEALGGASHLRHGDTDFAFGGLDRFRPVPLREPVAVGVRS